MFNVNLVLGMLVVAQPVVRLLVRYDLVAPPIHAKLVLVGKFVSAMETT